MLNWKIVCWSLGTWAAVSFTVCVGWGKSNHSPEVSSRLGEVQNSNRHVRVRGVGMRVGHGSSGGSEVGFCLTC